MKKIFKHLILFVILFIIQNLFLGKFFIKNDIISDFISFLSIIFGFYITSLAIFVTSKYVAELYKTTDHNNPRVTLLHTLMNNYKFGLNLILISILYLLIVQFILNQSEADSISLANYYLFAFLWVIVINFWYSYRMLNDLIKIILQEAKNN